MAHWGLLRQRKNKKRSMGVVAKSEKKTRIFEGLIGRG